MKHFQILFFVFFVSSFSHAQVTINGIIEASSRLLTDYPQEKVYLHIDRPYYLTGDTIWIKAYHVVGPLHLPSTLSLTIHIELFNSEKELLHQISLKSDKGYTSGNLVLPDSLKGGTYLLRAYTPWMRNFGEDFYFHREVEVFSSPAYSLPYPDCTLDNALDVQFFPESGELLEGIRTRIGFKVIGSDGLGKQVKLRIIDDKKNEILLSESNPLGMGAFFLMPESGKNYFALIDAEVTLNPLPVKKVIGYNMAITEKEDEVIVRIQATKSTPDKKNSTLICQSRGAVVYAAKIDLSHNLAFISIPKDSLLNGVSVLTLFDGNNRPVAERLIFLEHEDDLNVQIATDKAEYHSREKVTLNINITDNSGHPMMANISLAVTDDQQVDLSSSTLSLKSYLLLTSELTGFIENPGYYFNKENIDRHNDLDLLMLTQGWRRFVWADLLNNKWPAITHESDQGFSISGKLIDILTKKPISRGKVTYFSRNSQLDIHETTTDEFGKFRLTNLIFFDSLKAVLQGENKRQNKTVLFKIDSVNNPRLNHSFHQLKDSLIDKACLERNFLRKQNDDSFEFSKRATILKNVTVKSHRIEEKNPLKIWGTPSASLKTSDIIGHETYLNPLQLLQGRVSGVHVFIGLMSYSVRIRGAGIIPSENPIPGHSGSPLIMIDNIPIDPSSLTSYSTSDIESVEVFKGADAAIFGARGANGAILFYTKRGAVAYDNTNPLGILQLNLIGYQSEKIFYSPRYDVVPNNHDKIDMRPTIFWDPNVKTDKNGDASVTFFTSDSRASMTVLLEGIDSSGQIVQGKHKIAVIKE